MHGLKVSGSMVLDDLRPYRYHKIRYKTVHCSIDLHCDALRRIHYRTTNKLSSTFTPWSLSKITEFPQKAQPVNPSISHNNPLSKVNLKRDSSKWRLQ